MNPSPESIQQAKSVSIVAYLHGLDINPVKSVGNELAYHSPITQERSPSFFVNPSKNVFTDYSSNTKGDIISLVRYLSNCTFNEAINTLSNFTPQENDPSFSFSGEPHSPQGNGISIQSVKPLQHPALIQYVESRKIPLALASKYLTQVHYQNTKGAFFSVGFRNDKGGFELRNQHFKGSTSPKSITSFLVVGSDKVCLFEGFFDFLSALAHYQREAPRFSTVVLNSTANLSQALPMLKGYAQINTFLDTDKAGIHTLKGLKDKGYPIQDYSYLYNPFKDFNEYLKNS